MSECRFVLFDLDDIKINKYELANRLNMPAGFEDETLQLCICEVERSAKPMFCYRKTDISVDGNVVDFGFLKTASSNLSRNMSGCREAFVMAATLGMDTDRLISKVSAVSKAKGFILDAVSSALIEAVMDCGNKLIADEYNLRTRFSAGYGDFDLSCQGDILRFLNADKLLGIKLGDNLMMTPKKSITAVCAVERG